MKTYIKPISYFLIVAAASLSASQVLAAAVVNPATQPPWSLGAFTLKQPNLQLGATNAYRTWYENGAWQGDVIEYDIDTAGIRTTDVTVGANPATDGINNWSARYEFDNQEATVTDYWKAAAGRKVITYNTITGGQAAFRWDTISATQQNLVDPATATAGLTGPYASPILNFVRGDRSQEVSNGVLRKRHNLLGDPGKVTPLYVGPPSQSFLIPGHAQYKSNNASRAGRVIVAANDGMVHVFDADTGIEVYAYVPSMLFPTLNQLTEVGYVHTWYADGQLASGDAKIGTAWKTLVAGGLGAGAKGLFALDVTTPALSSETSTAAADTKVLWEKTGSNLGYIHGKPSIAPLSNGTWYVFSGNGYGSTNGTAMLYMAPVDGSTPVTIATSLVAGNGLSAPALVDINGDSDVDIAYAGDLLGNLWKFDLNNPGTAAELLFAAGINKPITTAPDVAVHPNGGFLVYIATGSLLSAGDAADTSQQTVYAIWDYPNRSATVTDGVDGNGNAILLSQTLSSDTYVDPADNTLLTTVRLATGNIPNWSINRGWKVDLASNSGERVIGEPQLRGNRLQFVTDLPTTNSNNPTGESWLLELDWLSGGDINSVFFDLNGDGVLNNSDKVVLPDTSLVVPIGVNLGQGNRSQPSFARVANGADTIFINGINLDVFTCEGVCAGGLQGGHVDVDTDTPGGGLGGSTNAHIHEYDVKYNVTFMNYFDLEPPNGSTLNHVDQVGIGVNTPFVAILANADLSPGGKLTLGNKQWNVVDYQETIQQLLLNYDGTNSNTLVDAAGDSLVFTLQGILNSGGTLEISFKDTALISGGLHPTQTSCVKDQLTITNGRWRNGALTIHLIQLDTIGSGASAGNTWIAQNPTDLATGMVGGGLHANLSNNGGFLYESTLFWHFGTLSQIINGTKPCYGDAGYDTARATELAGLTLAEFSALFPNYATQQNYIDSLADQLTTYTCAKGVGKDCKKEQGYKDLENLLKGLVGDVKSFLKLKYYLRSGSGSGGAGGGSGGNVAANVDGTGDTQDDAKYTATPTGRISWIDLRQ